MFKKGREVTHILEFAIFLMIECFIGYVDLHQIWIRRGTHIFVAEKTKLYLGSQKYLEMGYKQVLRCGNVI